MASRWFGLLPFLLPACTSTNDIVVELSPEIISSLDGTLEVRAHAFAGDSSSSDESVEVTITYTDRNGAAHTIDPVSGKTDDKGVFEAAFTGLTFDGAGVVTATIDVDGTPVQGTATFAVLDRSPPKVTIMPPANNQVRVNQDVQIAVHVTDEIGISQVQFSTDGRGGNNRNRSTITSGATDLTLDFDFQANDSQVGDTITVFALAGDLSGNQAAATPVMLTVIP